ncbi:efflux RND transporter periplasmic adaptor subunit [Sulfitobacter sp.]|uniref:efflux RND transporter periplasmic adaptor subunit n=1 Tax=Sulfitobacter sp. TaxID=1903071 RepID=UPI003001E72B
MTKVSAQNISGGIPAALLSFALVFGNGSAQAQQADPESMMDLDCLIEPRSIAELSAATDGIISEIYVKRGDRVQVGQALAQLDDKLETLQIELAQARAESDVNLRAQTSRLELRQIEFDRALQLEQRNVAAVALRQTAEIELALAKLAMEEAQLEQKVSSIELAQSKAIRDRRILRSPVDGIVTAVLAAKGEFANEQTPVITVAEIDPLHVGVFAPIAAFGRVSVGDQRQVHQLLPLDRSFDAIVTVVDTVFDAASGTFFVRLELPNPDGDIPAGTKCRVKL